MILKVLILSVQICFGFTECPECDQGVDAVEVVVFEDRPIDGQISAFVEGYNARHPKIFVVSRKIVSAREETFVR